jgi:Type VI secretion system/phage-baseplate injector OB domain
MASGFGGGYQGSVVDDADPIGEHRLRVIVPEVWGTEAGAWAVPYLPPGGAATPAVGDLVWVTFEGGDTYYPIWDAGAAPDPDAVPADGHVGRYRAPVADNVDPMEEHRLNVKIPEVLGDDTTPGRRPPPTSRPPSPPSPTSAPRSGSSSRAAIPTTRSGSASPRRARRRTYRWAAIRDRRSVPRRAGRPASWR